MYLRYTWNIPEIYLKCTWDIPEIYTWGIHVIYLRYTLDIPDIHLGYTWYTHKICMTFASDLSNLIFNCELPERYLRVTWELPKSYLSVTWELPESCIRVTNPFWNLSSWLRMLKDCEWVFSQPVSQWDYRI